MLDRSEQNSCCSMDYDVPVSHRRIVSKKKLYAKAIYDNFADTPDELAFKKGDILTVIEQNTEGIEGWWLCTLRDRRGLCPGNRLRLLNSYDSGCFSLSPTSSPSPSLAASTATLNSSICSADIYENSSINSASINGSTGRASHSHLDQHPLQTQSQHLHQLQQRQGTRRSWNVSPNKVITPQRQGDVYIYNCSPSLSSSSSASSRHSQKQSHPEQTYSNQSIYQNLSMMSTNGNNNSHEFETYDIPKPATPVNYDCPKNVACRTPTSTLTRFEAAQKVPASIDEESYDIPRPLNSTLLQHQHTLTPSSSNSSLLTSDSLSLSFSSSNRSSLANMPDYDIPRRNPMPVRSVQQMGAQQSQQLRQSLQQQHHAVSNCMTYDFPLPPLHEKTSVVGSNSNSNTINTTKVLPLELSSALETLAKLQLETTTAITRLLSFVVPNWRSREMLEPNIMEVKLAAVRLRTALHDLAEFSEGALGNAAQSEDRNLSLKLRPLVRALRDADKLIQDSSDALDAQGGWTVEHLARSDDKLSSKPPDSLDQLIACAQTLTEDVRSTTSFVQGNAPLLFKRHLPSQAGNTEWLEDYDYVSLESKDAAAKKNSALREAIPANLKNKFDTVIKAAETNILVNPNSNVLPNSTADISNNAQSQNGTMTEEDKVVVRFYAAQISTHMGNLRQAIDSFMETVKKNQPPKFFIAYGKFVVVSAHNLVTIGDFVHRNISKEVLREKILRCTDALSDSLKTCVQKSRRAAEHFPSVTAVQEMVDSVVDISHRASELKTAMLQTAQLTI